MKIKDFIGFILFLIVCWGIYTIVIVPQNNTSFPMGILGLFVCLLVVQKVQKWWAVRKAVRVVDHAGE